MLNAAIAFPTPAPPHVAFLKVLSSALYFLSCILPLSTLISSQSLDHHLYADDTQLFFSFYPPDFHSSISHLQTALQEISSWMTANLLTLNSSKTEFLLKFSSLKQQLAKIQTLSTTHSSRNLGFIFCLSPTK